VETENQSSIATTLASDPGVRPGLAAAENMLVARYTPFEWRALAYGAKFVLALGVGGLTVLLAGELFDRTGSFDLLYNLLGLSAIVAGVGALLLPRLGAALILISSLAWAVSMTIIKSLSRTESALTLTVYAALFMSPIVLIPSIPVWENPSLVQLGWLFAEVPSGWSWAGGVIVFSAATYIAFREAKLGRDKRRA